MECGVSSAFSLGKNGAPLRNCKLGFVNDELEYFFQQVSEKRRLIAITALGTVVTIVLLLAFL
jgi:hypothetical protein